MVALLRVQHHDDGMAAGRLGERESSQIYNVYYSFTDDFSIISISILEKGSKIDAVETYSNLI